MHTYMCTKTHICTCRHMEIGTHTHTHTHTKKHTRMIPIMTLHKSVYKTLPITVFCCYSPYKHYCIHYDKHQLDVLSSCMCFFTYFVKSNKVPERA